MKMFVVCISLMLLALPVFARNGVTYELNQGLGYIFQGDSWQSSVVVAYFANRLNTGDSEFSYKISFRKDLTQIDGITVTGGASFAQNRPDRTIEYSSNIVALPIGIRHPLSNSLQLDVFANIWSLEEKYFYDVGTHKSAFDSSKTGNRYFSSGGLALSLLF